MDKPTQIKDLLPELSLNVSNVKEINNNVKNVDELSINEITEMFENKFSSEKETQQFLANHLAKKLNNQKDINYFKKIVTQYDKNFLFECLNITLSAQREGGIKNPAAYFVGVINKKKPF